MDNHSNEALCARCAWAGGCRIPSESSEPIMSCETFEHLENLWKTYRLKTSAPDPSRMEGLCVDCGNRKSCVFRKREGGTWHCEEYC